MRISKCGMALGLGIALLGATGSAQAAGFKVNEQGAKAMAMANAFTAQADDPSALYYNPAGITQLSGTQVSLGSLIINVPQTEFVGSTPVSDSSSSVVEKAKRDIFIVPTMYLTHRIEGTPFALGFGVNSIYPLAKTWDDASALRRSIQDIAIKPINFQPTIAYKVNDQLSVAAGFDITYAQVSLKKMIGLDATDYGPLSVDGTATDLGYNFGLLWKPCTNIKVGANYRSNVKLHLEGNGNWITPAGSSTVSLYSPVSTTIELPDSIAFGVSWQATQKLNIEFDAERTGWSSYDKLQLTFTNPAFANFNVAAPKNWKDVWAYKVGGQYALTPNLDLRAGYAFDKSPIPDSTLGPELPDSDRHNFSSGIGIHKNNVALDLAYMYVMFKDRTVANSIQTGTYSSDVHLLAANVTVKF